MKENNKSKNPSTALYIINITARLVVICAIIALLVATVNYFTKDVISQNEIVATQNAISSLYEGNEIEICEIQHDIILKNPDIIDTIYHITDMEKNSFGYCVKLSPQGFKGEVDLLVAIDNDGFIDGVKIVSTNEETSGIGTKITNPSFTEKFIETNEEISDKVSLYTIAGATKTSKPVTEAIFTAKSAVKTILKTQVDAEQEVSQ